MTEAAHDRDSGSDAFLAIEHLSKAFGDQAALDDVDLVIRPAEIHALLGQNGSGKSTLIKTLAGLHRPDAGSSIMVDGSPLPPGSPRHAHHAGLRFVHQDLGLVGSWRVLDNLELTSESSSAWLSERRLRRRAEQLLDSYGLRVAVTDQVARLALAQRSMLAIIRAIHDLPAGRGLLILDEPTASLPPSEVARLLELLTNLRRQGLSILYVTHRLREVLAICDRVTVLRDGRCVAARPTAGLSYGTLVSLIVGGRDTAQAAQVQSAAPSCAEAPVLEVRNLSGNGFTDLSFDGGAGEIIGLTGLVGSGYETVLGHVFGAARAAGGVVTVAGHEIPAGRTDLAVRAGVGYVPSDRDSLGTIPAWSLGENLTLPSVPVRPRWRIVDHRAERLSVAEWTRELDITPAEPRRPLLLFSGGNRQRVAVGRWLRRGSAVLLLDEPTIGVDVAGKARVHALLRAAARRGAAVVLASSDHEEIASMCDRVIVMREGHVSAQLSTADINADSLVAASAGVADPDAVALSRVKAPEAR
jgi:ribose transport system ATP-binding protein